MSGAGTRQVLFRKRVAAWAVRLGVRPRQVRIQRMTHKWASCSTAGRVSFSTDLLQQPETFQNYVIVHELLHLKVPNHGKLFKSLLSLRLSAAADTAFFDGTFLKPEQAFFRR